MGSRKMVYFPEPIAGMESVKVEYLRRKRFRDWLLPPEKCDVCGAPVRLTHNSEVYGRSVRGWPFIYCCKSESCGAYVGLHPHSLYPLGKMADKATRLARQQVHAQLDRLWKFDESLKDDVYRWLSEITGIPPKKCHVSHFSEAQCRHAIERMQASQFKLCENCP